MDFEQMKAIDGELQRLEDSAHHAGRHGASWIETWMAMVEPLSKIVGNGAVDERLRFDHCYTTSRWAIYQAWRRGEADATVSDNKPRTPHVTPPRLTLPWNRGTDKQGTLFDVSEAYE